MALHTFEDLEVWKRASRLAVDVCAAVHPLKMFSLKNQIERSAVSIPSNIVEGVERDSGGDFIRFLRIAKGSCAELRTQLYIAARYRINWGWTSSTIWSTLFRKPAESQLCYKG